MDERIKDSIIKIILVWVLIGAALTLPTSCCKLINTFYKQVIQDTPSISEEPRVIIK